jgi:hypothetical protein
MPILLVIVGLVLVVLVTTRTLFYCSHCDENGTSALLWHREPGRLCGWCPYCGRTTRGWRIG